MFLRLLNNHFIALLFRYGLVGVFASAVHFSIAYLSYNSLQLSSFVAHFCGFVFGLFTAYFGHYFYSFKDDENHSKRFPKFVITSFVSLFLHQAGVYLLVNQFSLDYSTRVLPILIVTVPLFSFLLNRFWVFSEMKPSK